MDIDNSSSSLQLLPRSDRTSSSSSLLSDMSTHKIKLQSSDGDTFDVEVDIAKQSATIKTMLEGQRRSLLVLLLLDFASLRSRNGRRRRRHSASQRQFSDLEKSLKNTAVARRMKKKSMF